MKQAILFSSTVIFSLLSTAALADDPLFASPEERVFVLELAGLDGQIDSQEWDNRNPERESFKSIDWPHFDAFDLDENGSISVNEFCQFLMERRKWSGQGETPTTKTRTRDQASVSSLPEGVRRAKDFDKSMLFQRARIARRTKFQNRPDPVEEAQLQRSRFDHLNTLREKRRFSAARQPIRQMQSEDATRDLYRSKLVKYRITRSSPEGESPTRAALRDFYRKTPQAEEGSRRRNELNKVRSRSGQSTTPRPLRPAPIRQSPEKGRISSDIRGLLPDTHSPRKGTPTQAPNGKTKGNKKESIPTKRTQSERNR